jgi:hypothetical protein
MRQRPSILNILQLAIGAYVAWQFQRSGLFDQNRDAVMPPMEDFFRLFQITFLGVFAILALRFLRVLAPMVSWGVEQIRRQRAKPDLSERIGIAQRAEQQASAQCPTCGASLFDDAPACPWCGHPLS